MVGETSLERAAEQRLRAAPQVWQFVVSVESAETTRAWWMGMKEQFGGLSPAEAIAAGEQRAVMSVARDLVGAADARV